MEYLWFFELEKSSSYVCFKILIVCSMGGVYNFIYGRLDKNFIKMFFIFLVVCCFLGLFLWLNIC